MVFALCGSWGIATGVSGLIFTVLALVNYYTRDLHGSALMPQDILNLGTAAEVMGSYTCTLPRQLLPLRCCTSRCWWLPLCGQTGRQA